MATTFKSKTGVINEVTITTTNNNSIKKCLSVVYYWSLQAKIWFKKRQS